MKGDRAAVAAVLLLVVACGKKGPPLPPLRPVPAAVGGLTARVVGDEVSVQFTVPAQNQDGTRPADVARVDVYALTVAPLPPGAAPLVSAELVRYGTRVATVAVRPPATETRQTPGETAGGSQAAPDRRPGQGEVVTILDPLSADRWRPVDLVALRGGSGSPSRSAPPGVAVPLWAPPVEVPLRRVYVAVGVSSRGRRGALAGPVAVPLVPAPAAPSRVSVCYDERTVTVEWHPPASARRAVQEPPGPTGLGARPLIQGPPPTRYNVYERPTRSPAGSEGAPARPLNATPLAAPPFVEARVEFGTERCYVVRAVDTIGGAMVESAPSAPACVALIDVFPPQPPQGLSAVAGAGAIHLVWTPNSEADLAGYLILRGEAPGEKLQPLTPTPLRETTYQDVSVRPGVRYVYAVVALDTAGNVSAPSARVEETAR